MIKIMMLPKKSLFHNYFMYFDVEDENGILMLEKICYEKGVKFKVLSQLVSDDYPYSIISVKVSKRNTEKIFDCIINDLPKYLLLHGYTDYEDFIEQFFLHLIPID